MNTPIRVSLSVTSDNPEVITRAMESMARAATGLALEGVSAFIMLGPDEDED